MPNIVLLTAEEQDQSLSHGLILCSPEEAESLMHFGIKGQKHGIRRWQNEDGSLTPEGYIHYGVGQGNRDKAKADKFQAKADKTQLKADKYKVKADKYAKRAEKNEERGKEEIERDKERDAELKAKEEKADHDKEVVKKINDLRDRMSQYDSMSPEEKKSFGDDLLRGLDEYNEWADKEREDRGYKVGEAHKIEGFYNSREIENKLFDLVYKKAGSWNGEDWVKGSESEKTYPAVSKAYEDQWAREDEVKQQINYQTIQFKPNESFITSNKRKKEYERLQKALKNDKIWNSLNEVSRNAERDMAGAILRDLGFSDTPENRSLIWPYTYLD